MSKVRLQDVAKELGVGVKSVKDLLKSYGIEKTNFSHLEEEELQIIYDNFSVEDKVEKEIATERKAEKPSKEQEKQIRRKPKPLLEERKHTKATPKPLPTQPVEKEQKVEEKPKEEAPAVGKISKEEHNILKKLEKQIEKKKKEEKKEEIKIVQIPDVITVRELSEILNVPYNQVMAELLKKGVLATINQTIPSDVAVQIAEGMGYLVEMGEAEKITEEEEAEELAPENMRPRPPVVVVMGHVDHGKTTLLDAVRKTNVAEREKGGITQHIGASVVELPDKRAITFLDTPGHEAFTSLRARGAQVTDIAVLVVAADDGVMPQTVEAINHAKAFNVPVIVAVNKIDKPGADPQKVRRELSELGLIPEEWGGDTIFVDVSAKTGKNIDQLLEYILLLAEMLELKANPTKKAKGTVIESRLDKQRGTVATMLVQDGTLSVGDVFVVGTTYGKVRAMFDDKGRRLRSAGPSTPVEVLGFEELPMAGDIFRVVGNEKTARHISEAKRLQKERMEKVSKGLMLEDVFKKIQEGEIKEFRFIVKADTVGSLEALKKSLSELSAQEVSVRIVHSDVGGITENDVMLAKASNAVIIGFNTRPDVKARDMAEKEKVDLKLYGIIYEVVEDVKKALKGMLKPIEREVILGSAEVRAVFKVKGVGNIAGSYVLDGKILRNTKARLIRNGVVIYDGRVDGLKRFKDDVQEVARGFECGIKLKDYNDIKVGDVIECYEIKLEEAQL
ncbi:MAG: translation initiation factor IF-2 [Aquificaceae bacterium]